MSGLVMTGFGKWRILILLSGRIDARRRQAFETDLKKLARTYKLKVRELKGATRKARKKK